MLDECKDWTEFYRRSEGAAVLAAYGVVNPQLGELVALAEASASSGR